jgi:hypothetical protein
VNWRGGGFSGGRSWQSGCICSGEGGEELMLGHDRDENSEKRERMAADGLQAPRWRGVARGKRRGPYGCSRVVVGEGGEGAPGVVVGSVA